MQQPFALSIPRAVRFSEIEENREIHFWRNALDLLAGKKWSWERFFQDVPPAHHPSLRLTSFKEEHSLLHLAVLSDRLDFVRQISAADAQLKYKRNGFGLTALELAQFLGRKEMIQVLSPASLPSPFPLQPNLSFSEEGEDFEALEFLPYPVFESAQVFDEALLFAKRAKEEDLIPAERIWMGVYFDQEIQRGAPPQLCIQRVDETIGYGVFAKKRIAPCAFVGEYTGVVKKRKSKQSKGEIYSIRYPFWGAEKQKFIIDAKAKGNFSRFINHSEQPNLCLQTVYWRGIPRMIFVALKEIPANAQLTFDYGPFFWKELEQAPQLL